MINALPDKDIDALERVVWSMSRSSDRISVYKGHDKFRIFIPFSSISTMPTSSLILAEAIDIYNDKILFVVYSDVKIPDPIRMTKRKMTTEEMKMLLIGIGFSKALIDDMHFTTDSPVRNERTIVDPSLFNLPQIVKTIET